jgi:peptidoglycan hydrolase-like protein with peptidoglycan-binding domain
MEAWKSVVALTVAGVFAVGSAWAQTPAPADKSTTGKADKADKTDKGTMTPADKTTTGTEKTDKAARGEMKGKGAKGDTAMKGANQEQVRMAQQALKDKGHDPGPIDGRMGPKTRAALKDFQKAQGLKASGQLDSETMAKLEMKTGAAAPSAPSASPATDATKSDAMKSDAPKDDAAKPAEMPKPADAPKADAPKDATQPSASPATGATDTKTDAAKPDASSAPAASPSTGTTDTTKPADPAKPTEEKKQ